MNNLKLKWSAKIVISSPWSVTQRGWIYLDGASNDNQRYVKIDGVEIARNSGQRGDWVDSMQVQALVFAGDTIEFNATTAYFVPLS